MFKILKDTGVVISEKYNGIYYLTGNITFDTQIIVTRKLDGDKRAGLKILSRDAQENDVRKFLEEAKLAKEPGDLHNIDAVLQVNVSANKKLYEAVRRDKSMCQALKDLMKEEIEAEKAAVATAAATTATAKTKLVDIKELMKNMKWTAEQAMKALGITAEDQAKYSAML